MAFIIPLESKRSVVNSALGETSFHYMQIGELSIS